MYMQKRVKMVLFMVKRKQLFITRNSLKCVEVFHVELQMIFQYFNDNSWQQGHKTNGTSNFNNKFYVEDITMFPTQFPTVEVKIL